MLHTLYNVFTQNIEDSIIYSNFILHFNHAN